MAFWQISGSSSANGDHKGFIRSSDIEAAHGSSSRSSGEAGPSSSSSRLPMKTARTGRKIGKNNGQQCSVVFFLAILIIVVITFLGSQYIVFVGFPGDSGLRDDFFDHSEERESSVIGNLALPFRILDKERQGTATKRELRFGQGFRDRDDRDSRDWDTDDRDRSYGDVNKTFDQEYSQLQQELQGNSTSVLPQQRRNVTGTENTGSKTPGLVYERGRKELRRYEQQYEAELNSTAVRDDDSDDDEDYDDEEPNDGVVEQEENFSIGRAAREDKAVDIEPVKYYDMKPVKPRRGGHRRGPCEIKFSNATRLREPENSSKFAKFGLDYVTSERPSSEDSEWRPRFEGHQTMLERERSFLATKNQTVHCGFIQDADSNTSTGFDISPRDRDFLATCRIAVSSCIFGKSDQFHTPRRRTFSSSSRKEACMVLFVDEPTLDIMTKENQAPDGDGYVGLWRVVLVKNLPFSDLRLVGKIPKFLSHRLFPSARYSIWLDSKLRLQSDPLSILEYFLWRGNREYSISNHYDRHCVWDEVQQNKKLNKFNHTLIDEQFRYYQSDGLIKFNASDPKRLLPSYVPEGSLIIRAHTPMSNLFSCLWFNEAVRFTPRDQLSFAYTYMKLVRTNPRMHFRLHMFKDCERKMITKLFRHRQLVDKDSVQ